MLLFSFEEDESFVVDELDEDDVELDDADKDACNVLSLVTEETRRDVGCC